jgi:hypothetical protein
VSSLDLSGVDLFARTIADFGSGSLPEPRSETILDITLGCRGVLPSQVLTHELDPEIEQLQRRLKRSAFRRIRGVHS